MNYISTKYGHLLSNQVFPASESIASINTNSPPQSLSNMQMDTIVKRGSSSDQIAEISHSLQREQSFVKSKEAMLFSITKAINKVSKF